MYVCDRCIAASLPTFSSVYAHELSVYSVCIVCKEMKDGGMVQFVTNICCKALSPSAGEPVGASPPGVGSTAGCSGHVEPYLVALG